MKALAVVGTAAMFLVGGGILTHGLPGAHDVVHALVHAVEAVPGAGGVLGFLAPLVADGVVGIVAGALVLGGVRLAARLMKGARNPDQRTEPGPRH
jgi:predicted DNA repair protein MutK